MKSAMSIKRLFAKSDVTVDPKVDDRIINDALTAMDKSEKTRSIPAELSIWRKTIKSKITKLGMAAAIIIGVLGLLVFFFGNGETLHAQIIKAIENARTIHAVVKSLDNGKWGKKVEVWYEQGKGIAEAKWEYGEKTYIRIDNGQYMWEYHTGDDFAKRSITIDPMGITRALLNVDSFKKQAIRCPDKDKVVDGLRYLAYLSSYNDNRCRILTWLDDSKRVRAWEKMRLLDNSRWETYRIGEVEYNVELNPEVFEHDFGQDIEIVEVDTKLDENFDLDDALFTKEELGLIFAVHELVKCDEGVIFAVSSIRPTDAWRKKVRVSSGHSWVWNYGSFHFGSSWKRLDNYGRGRSYQPISLGWIYHAGLQVRWTLFFPKGFESEDVKECELEVYMSNRGALARKRSESGLPTEERFKPIAVLPLPKETVPLAQVMDEAYSKINELEPFVSSSWLTLKWIPFTDEEMEKYIKEHPDSGETSKYRSGDRSKNARLLHGQASKPGEIGKENWVKDRMDYLKEIENNYKEFLQKVKKREQENR